MNVTDVFNRVKRAFGDESAVQLTEDDIIRHINDAQREAAMQSEGLLPIVTYSDLVAKQKSYAVPDNILTVHFVYCRDHVDGQYWKLKWLNLWEFSTFCDGWEGSWYDGFPRVYTKETNGNIIIFPIPDSDISQGLKLHAARYPVDVATSADPIDLPEYLHAMVVNYCLMQAYEMDEDWEGSARKQQQVQGDLDFNNNRDAWYGRDTFPIVAHSEADFYYG